LEIGNRTQQLSAMPERRNANLFEILIGQFTQNGKINVVLSEMLNVLLHIKLLKPIRNLLHRSSGDEIFPLLQHRQDGVFILLAKGL
jgi:hypothetical protein